MLGNLEFLRQAIQSAHDTFPEERVARLRLKLGLLAVLFGACLLAPAADDHSAREVKSRIAPTYPEIARRMQISGKVRLEVVIAPDGRVKEVHPLGGHPVLLDAATNAVKGWRFSSGSGEAKQVVEIDFKSAEPN
jgi:TonB family protein